MNTQKGHAESIYLVVRVTKKLLRDYNKKVDELRVLEEEIRSLRHEKEAIFAEKEIVVAKEKECLRNEMEKKMDVI